MSNPFFDQPILNSPYERPSRHWELDASRQPTQQILEWRRRAEFITPTPKPKKQRTTPRQESFLFDEGDGLSTKAQQYDPTSIINEVRNHVDTWRALPNPSQWQVTPETARLLQHWRHHRFSGVRPFFCQVEAVETAIWLTEVAPGARHGKRLLDHLAAANKDANPELMRLALKLATGVGKTTVIAMLIAWQTINAVRRPASKQFTRDFLICAPGLTIKDRLRVLQPNDPDSYYKERELLPSDLLDDLGRAKIVITNYHAFKLRERVDLSKGGRQLLKGRAGDHLTDQELLREVMNTVGKAGQLGGSIRCVVSVAMLTEGWDANTVTHVLGIRAFGTQLLCEQVIGRALRRQSYELNEEGLFNVEYADVFGIPFDFTAKPVVAKPQPPRETVQVKAVRPDRDALEIIFPRVEGYRVELPEERLQADFNDDSTLTLTPDLVGPCETRNEGIIGEGVTLTVKHLGDIRVSTVLYELTKRLLYTHWRDPGEAPKLHLFGQLKRIAKDWLDQHLECKGGAYPAQLLYLQLADLACEKITAAITRRFLGERPIKALLDPYNPSGSTRHVRFNTSKPDRWKTRSTHCHLNWVVLDSDWDGEFCRVAEAHPKVRAYVKNHGLGFEVPYRYGSETRKYLPDFIVLVDDGQGADDLLRLVVEIKGYRCQDTREKKSTMDTYWTPGVNHLGIYGRWAFAEFTDVFQMQGDFAKKVEAEFDRMLAGVRP